MSKGRASVRDLLFSRTGGPAPARLRRGIMRQPETRNEGKEGTGKRASLIASTVSVGAFLKYNRNGRMSSRRTLISTDLVEVLKNAQNILYNFNRTVML